VRRAASRRGPADATPATGQWRYRRDLFRPRAEPPSVPCGWRTAPSTIAGSRHARSHHERQGLLAEASSAVTSMPKREARITRAASSWSSRASLSSVWWPSSTAPKPILTARCSFRPRRRRTSDAGPWAASPDWSAHVHFRLSCLEARSPPNTPDGSASIVVLERHRLRLGPPHRHVRALPGGRSSHNPTRVPPN
jgi:hypothetical protein